MKYQYWLVGAMWGGEEDTLDLFLKRGYWYAWSNSDDETPKQTKDRFPKIRVNDRIAVKKIIGKGRGKGSEEIEIRALGVVTDVDLDEWRIYVDWKVTDVNKRVPIKGVMGSIHGPYDIEEDSDCWLKTIFSI